jgi:deoxyribodipyrimidine photo-lyase
MADTVIHWFRRDLRLDDNTALDAALRSGDLVLPVFIIDDAILGHTIGEHRLRFLRTALVELDAELRRRGSRLLVRRGDAPRELNRVAEEADAWGAYYNRDHTPYARERDTRATRGLQMTGVVTQTFDDLLLVPPHATLDAEGKVARTFGAFSRRWFQQLDVSPHPPASPEGRLVPLAETPESILDWPESLAPGLSAPSGWPGATTASARGRLMAFVADSLAGYERRRDFPAEDATSRLSAALKFGTISVREVARAVLGSAAADEGSREGSERFIRELAWREYAHHLLHSRPDLLRHPLREPGRPALAAPPGVAEARWQAWREGRTGLPLVDAGMRQLEAEGWMHNRVRMLVASVLSHQLGLDFRIGERHFIRHLIDADIASNDLGWQRAVGVGVLPSPYRRTPDAVIQGRKFDPHAEYVKRWVNELARVPERYVHRPWQMPPDLQASSSCRIGIDYPQPVVAPAFPRALPAPARPSPTRRS